MPKGETSVILITGLPCSGKTTLARQMGLLLNCEVLSKDDFKESMAIKKSATLNHLDRSITSAQYSRTLGIAAEEALMQKSIELAKAGASHIVESVFRPEYIAQYLRDITALTKLTVVILRCDREVLMDRFGKRDRHGVHNDAEFMKSFAAEQEIDAKDFSEYTDAVLEFDTTTISGSIFADELSHALATHL